MVQTIRFWQSRLRSVYPNGNIGPDYMMAHLYTACSDLGRDLLRAGRPKTNAEAIFGAVSWSIALSNYFQIDYQDALVSNFPMVCRYCLKAPCECDSTGKRAVKFGRTLNQEDADEELMSKIDSLRQSNLEITFPWLIGQLHRIYPANRALLVRGSGSFIVGKMLEEGGELHRAYSTKLQNTGSENLRESGKNAIAEEIADVTAWVISCWNIEGLDLDFESELARHYIGGCPVCNSHPCVCPPYSITRANEEAINLIVHYLRQIASSDIDHGMLDEVRIEAEDAKTNPTPEKTRTLVTRLKSLVNFLKGAKDASEGAHSIAHDIGELIEHIDLPI